MKIQIILTNYLLQFMYGDQTFQDPLLLSREVLKKAYHEGLYYISSKEMIEKISATAYYPNTLYLFAGVPTIEEISLTHTIRPELYALKLKLPYESLAKFTYQRDQEDAYMESTEINTTDITLEKVMLKLDIVDQVPCYQEEAWKEDQTLSFEDEMTKEMENYFFQHLKQYSFVIKRKLDFLLEQWNLYFCSEQSKQMLEDENLLQYIKECYEELIYDNEPRKL